MSADSAGVAVVSRPPSGELTKGSKEEDFGLEAKATFSSRKSNEEGGRATSSGLPGFSTSGTRGPVH